MAHGAPPPLEPDTAGPRKKEDATTARRGGAGAPRRRRMPTPSLRPDRRHRRPRSALHRLTSASPRHGLASFFIDPAGRPLSTPELLGLPKLLLCTFAASKPRCSLAPLRPGSPAQRERHGRVAASAKPSARTRTLFVSVSHAHTVDRDRASRKVKPWPYHVCLPDRTFLGLALPSPPSGRGRVHATTS